MDGHIRRSDQKCRNSENGKQYYEQSKNELVIHKNTIFIDCFEQSQQQYDMLLLCVWFHSYYLFGFIRNKRETVKLLSENNENGNLNAPETSVFLILRLFGKFAICYCSNLYVKLRVE
jgi:hypothetical protein